MNELNNLNGSKFLVSYSIVSHGQGQLIEALLADFREVKYLHELIITINIAEDLDFLAKFNDLPIILIEKLNIKGFGENHNSAFEIATGDIFIIVNPDIRLPKYDENILLDVFKQEHVGAVAPLVLNSSGGVEDSVRRFPTFFRLFCRTVFRIKKSDYVCNDIIEVDWVAGMFVAFRVKAYKSVNGFDEKYFMYMEDADIAYRLKKKNWAVKIQPNTSVVHDAQRASKKKLNHLWWHINSAIRYLLKNW
ncbi:glycosyltransferase family 2 protein [Iodobacter fluviatilis]|uniref:Glycosyl transferase n=1 Tax=Iodobacter fluviatilis TaxID=537 RepID=A0A7G3G7K0_9NEIS|nr:galactosyltransferase-related protein [Iodobacter fluviatilis]QBC43119.1 glycosyl transferase [Iodobacter fluviatilis]